MSPGHRCDEILRLIDDLLEEVAPGDPAGADPRGDVGPTGEAERRRADTERVAAP